MAKDNASLRTFGTLAQKSHNYSRWPNPNSAVHIRRIRAALFCLQVQHILCFRLRDPSRPNRTHQPPPGLSRAASGVMTVRDTPVWPSLRLCVKLCFWNILAAELVVDGEPPRLNTPAGSPRGRYKVSTNIPSFPVRPFGHFGHTIRYPHPDRHGFPLCLRKLT